MLRIDDSRCWRQQHVLVGADPLGPSGVVIPSTVVVQPCRCIEFLTVEAVVAAPFGSAQGAGVGYRTSVFERGNPEQCLDIRIKPNPERSRKARSFAAPVRSPCNIAQYHIREKNFDLGLNMQSFGVRIKPNPERSRRVTRLMWYGAIASIFDGSDELPPRMKKYTS